MARERPIENPPLVLSSQDEEDAEEERNDDDDEETDVKSPVIIEKHNPLSDSEGDDSDNTFSSQDISDFTIKPIIKRPGSKRPPLTPESESMKMKKKKKEEERSLDGLEAPVVVLGLPCPVQRAAFGEKKASNYRVRSEVNVKRQQLNEGKKIDVKRQQLDQGKRTIDGKSKKLMMKMLEIYIKSNELVQQQTRLLLEELKSEKI